MRALVSDCPAPGPPANVALAFVFCLSFLSSSGATALQGANGPRARRIEKKNHKRPGHISLAVALKSLLSVGEEQERYLVEIAVFLFSACGTNR